MIADAPRRFLRRAWRWRAGQLLPGVLLLGALGTTVQASSVQAQEGSQALQVEAAFLVNFVRFTQWPPNRFNNTDTPYVIAVVGGDDVAQTVRTVANAAGNIQGRDIAVVRVDPADVEGRQKQALDIVRGSHLVFVRSSDADVRRQVLAAVAGTPVLTVGDEPEFAARGGMLGLVRAGDHLAFEANPEQIQAAGVQLSAKVLKLARIRRRAS